MTEKIEHPRENLRGVIRTIITGQCFAAPLPQVLINGGVFSLLILQLGGSKFEVGLVFTLEFIAHSTRVFAARYADVHNQKRMVIRWQIISNAAFLLILLVEPIRLNLGNQAAIWAALVVFFIQRLAIHYGMTAFHPLVADLLPAPIRGRFFGAMRGSFQITALIVSVAAGLLLGDDPAYVMFYILFVVMTLASFVRPALFFIKLPDPQISEHSTVEPLSKTISRPFKDVPFRHFLMFWAYLVFALNLGRPFTVPYMKQDLNFPSSITIYASSLLVLGMAISLVRWGRLADKLGNRLVFLLNVVIIAVSMVVLAFVPHYDASPVGAVIVSVIAITLLGIAIGGLGIGHTVRNMHAAPPRNRGAYMSAFFVTNGVVSAITSSLAGYILDTIPSFVTIFGYQIPLMRIYFPFVGILLLFSILILKNIVPIYERSIRESVSLFVGSLPTVVALPFQAIRAVADLVDRNGKARDDGRDRSTKEEDA